MACLNVPRSIVCAIAQKNDSRPTSARSSRHAGWATQDGSSGIARDATIIDRIVNDTMTMVTTITTIAIMAAVDADSDKQNANATIKKKHADERGKRREGNDCRATSTKKTWVQRDERRRNEKSGCDDHERRLRDEAHAINNLWTSSDNKSCDNDKKTVAREEEKSKDNDEHDSFAVAMAPPAKKAKTTHRDVSRNPRKVVESNDDFDAFLAKMASLLGDRGNDPLPI
jgi:hypothetical protein